MKRVRFLTNTAYKGARQAGEVIQVPDDFAARWVKNKIAEYVDIEPDSVEVEVEVTPEEVPTPLIDMNAKELYQLCKDKGIEVEAKMPKQHYIDLLSQ